MIMTHILHEEFLFPHLIYSFTLQGVDPYQSLHITWCVSLSMYLYTFQGMKHQPLISLLQCCEPCNFIIKLFVNIQHSTLQIDQKSLKIEADLLTSWSGNNPNYWLVVTASLIVQKLIKVMNVISTYCEHNVTLPPHSICKKYTTIFTSWCSTC